MLASAVLAATSSGQASLLHLTAQLRAPGGRTLHSRGSIADNSTILAGSGSSAAKALNSTHHHHQKNKTAEAQPAGSTTQASPSTPDESVMSHLHRRKAIEQGWPTQSSRLPFVAYLTRSDTAEEKYICTGSLIHPRVVVTAAHCVEPEVDGCPNPGVVLGRSSLAQWLGIERRTSRSFPHPKFQAGSFDYDIAVLILDTPSSMSPVRLVDMGAPLGQGPRTSSSGSKYLPYHAWRQLDSNDADQSVFEGMQLTVAGWGATSAGTLSNALMQGNVQPLAHDKCIEMFKPWDSKITPRMICTTGNTCAGDSGGPLLLPANLQQQAASSSWLLVGHTSFGFPREKGQGCPTPGPSGRATAFTDLSSPQLRQFLRSVVQQEGLNVDLGAPVPSSFDGSDSAYSSLG
ncbi:hypothetical protein QJQ45_014739 [Haematococcus lacustris]|nr:hypothetical protein QJQ45_014739 [Haematococcus lacustris]